MLGRRSCLGELASAIVVQPSSDAASVATHSPRARHRFGCATAINPKASPVGVATGAGIPSTPMPWLETPSLSFVARHEDGDEPCAERTLDALEELRIRLEDRFEQAPGGITVVIHPTTAWLAGAHPFLPAARAVSAPAGRRYIAGWAMSDELHCLNDEATAKRAAGQESLAALQGTAERLYTQIVLAANNDMLPPPWTPRRFFRYLNNTWLIEGAAQHFAGQVKLLRPAAIRRLREGRQPGFPPSARDAIILGGTVFDLLADRRGDDACDLLVSRFRKAGVESSLELAFDAPLAEIEAAWRQHLDDKVVRSSGPDPTAGLRRPDEQ